MRYPPLLLATTNNRFTEMGNTHIPTNALVVAGYGVAKAGDAMTRPTDQFSDNEKKMLENRKK